MTRAEYLAVMSIPIGQNCPRFLGSTTTPGAADFLQHKPLADENTFAAQPSATDRSQWLHSVAIL